MCPPSLHACVKTWPHSRNSALPVCTPSTPSLCRFLDDVFISEYVAGALLGVIIWWLENDLPHSPEYMSDRFGWLSVAGTYKMMGIQPPSLHRGLASQCLEWIYTS